MADGPTGQPNTSNGKRIWVFGVIFAFGFTTLIWILGSNLNGFLDTLIHRNDLSWYYWKLPVRDMMAMTIAWSMYLANQLLIWIVIFYAQRDINGFRSATVLGLPKYNLYAIAIIVAFTLLHLLQTQLWFDGLAQDTPIMSSQGSVIVMLSVILVMENPRRGLFLGRRAGKPFTAQAAGFFRRTHMYIFSWAMVYTFWFHPMATDPQLLSGFFYMFLLFTQMAIAWTPAHLDRRWIVLLESYVAIHAVIVAIFNTSTFGGPDMWPMFFSGFAFMFVFTYMYALNVGKRAYLAVTALYAAFVAWLYIPSPVGFGRDTSYLMRMEFLWIPIILYALAALFAALALIRKNKPASN